jgi:two-component system, LuxR family, response regulator FixJ
VGTATADGPYNDGFRLFPTPMPDVTIFVVAHDVASRDSLSLAISGQGLRASLFRSGGEFLSVYREDRRGCLLVDTCATADVERACLAELPGIVELLPAVVLVPHGNARSMRAAFKAGAVDVLERPVPDEDLLGALTNAIRIDEARHRQQAQSNQVAERLARLSSRERAVLALLAQGLPHREIAERLIISPRTVEVYKARMMEKLQCRTLADVVLIGANAAG